MAYLKLDTQVLNSTLWVDKDCRDVFITALLMAEPVEVREPIEQLKVRSLEPTGFVVPPGWYGIVRAAGVGIVRTAMSEHEAGMAALERLGDPDPESRSQAFEGRRLVRVDGGYIALNFINFRERDHTSAFRSKRYRERLKEKAALEAAADATTEQSVEIPENTDTRVVTVTGRVEAVSSHKQLHKQLAVAGKTTELPNNTTPRARDGDGSDSPPAPSVITTDLTDVFTHDAHRVAYALLRAAQRSPEGFDRVLQSVHEPATGGARYDWLTIGQALLEAEATVGSAPVNAPMLRTFCRRLMPAPASTNGESQLTAKQQRTKAALETFGRNHGDA